jgi:hypothetical protein
MTVACHLRGYDKTTEFVGVEFDIPVTLLPFVKDLLPEAATDPDLIEPHELAADRVVRLARELGISVDPDTFDFYIEADEDWRLVEEAKARILEREADNAKHQNAGVSQKVIGDAVDEALAWARRT